jgi:hypothetical protein
MAHNLPTYGTQLYGTAANSNLEILQKYQSKVLRITINVPWYVTNETLHRNTNYPGNSRFVNDIATEKHPNKPAANLMKAGEIVQSLKRKTPTDLLI